MSLAGRVAVITGASSGIGAELARQLAVAGMHVGMTARRADRLDAVAAEIRDRGGTAATAPADAADPEQTRNAIARLADRLGPVDLLVANAGLGLTVSGLAFSACGVERLVRVNLLGAAYAIEAVLPAMLSRGRGQLVGVSSLAAFRGMPGGSGYCASKAGLSKLLESLRTELQPRGIAITVVHPGYVRTPMTADAAHWQPFLMDVEPAVRIIVRGIAAKRREINFPWQLVLLMRLANWLPGSLYDRLVATAMDWSESGSPPPPPPLPGPESEAAAVAPPQ